MRGLLSSGGRQVTFVAKVYVEIQDTAADIEDIKGLLAQEVTIDLGEIDSETIAAIEIDWNTLKPVK